MSATFHKEKSLSANPQGECDKKQGESMTGIQ